MKTKRRVADSPYKLVFAGLMVAMNILLGKFLVIDIGDIGRVSVSAVPVLLCGGAFGPLLGGAVGFTGDLLGCFLKGYAINPIILAGSTLFGVIPGLFGWERLRGAGYLRCLLLAASAMVPCSGVITTAGLRVFYGTPIRALLMTRLPVLIIEVPAVALVMTVLFRHGELISLIDKARVKERGAKNDRKGSH